MPGVFGKKLLLSPRKNWGARPAWSMLLSFHVLQTQTEAERQKIVSEFRQLRRFLKDQEVVLLAQLGELDREVMRRQEEEEAKVSGEISLLDILIWEAERKLEQPTSGFLQVGCSTGQEGRGSSINPGVALSWSLPPNFGKGN